MNKVVLITGTSSGFGRAAAETLARRGYSVIATMRDSAGRNRQIGEDLRSLAEQERWNLRLLDMDVTSEASVNQAAAQALDQVGRIDVVINNAGIGGVGITEAFTLEQFQTVLDVNFLGAVRVNRAVLPAMRRQRSGLLIHVSSVAGRVVVPGVAAYSASKFALEALADAYRFELAEFNIDSVLVEPGVHKTGINSKSLTSADRDRITAYEAAATVANNLFKTLEHAGNAPETPGPEVVVDSFIRLIETPAGQRPFRTVPTAAMQPLLLEYNDAAASLRETVAEMFGVSERTAARSAHSAR